MRILLIEDSEDMGLLVRAALRPYDVVQAVSIQHAFQLLENEQFQLLLIDVGLPDGDGFSFCESLSRDPRFERIPKIILSGQNETSQKVFGLNSGADDYITKPFEVAELKARVDTRLRVQKTGESSVVRFDNLEFESDFQRCSYVHEGQRTDLQLTPTEYRILLAMARAEGRPLTRQEIVRGVWQANGLNIEARGIDSHIAHLRRKLETCEVTIVSVYGKGYALKTSLNRAAA